MSQLKKGPTPLRTNPSSAPYEAMAASQQAHIDQLVQQSRTQDQTVKRLQEDLAREQTRSKDALQQIQLKWQAERREWLEGCETIQACHRIAHLRTTLELSKERSLVLDERDLARREKRARLQRDYRLTLFQAKEAELEDEILRLRDELAEAQAGAEDRIHSLTAKHREYLLKAQGQIATLQSDLEERAEELQDAEAAREKLHTELSDMREENERLLTSSSSTTTQVDRLQLKIASLESNNADLERLKADLERSNAELKRKVTEWENLEGKSSKDTEAERQKRVHAEIRVKELEGRLEDAAGREEELVERAEKYKQKVEKFKSVWKEHTDATEEAQDAAIEWENQAQEVQLQLQKALKEIEGLRDDLQKVHSKQKTKAGTPTSKSPAKSTAHDTLSDDDIEDMVAMPPKESPAKARPKPRPANRKKVDEEVTSKKRKSPEDAEEESGRAKKGKGKQKKTAKNDQREEESDEVEVVEQPVGKGKGKSKASSSAAKARKGKEKAQVEEEEEESEVPKKRSKPPSKANGKKSANKVSAVDESEEEDAPQKKKRKIKLFPSAQAASFPWKDFNLGDGGLNIPTELSPVKESEPVVPRSFFGKGGSALSLNRR